MWLVVGVRAPGDSGGVESNNELSLPSVTVGRVADFVCVCRDFITGAFRPSYYSFKSH